MGSAAVANHALSCPSYGGFLHEGPSTSNSKRVLFQRTGLLALPRQTRSPCGRHSQSLSGRAAATAGYALLENSSPSIDVEGIVAEAPTLLALSSDLDWQQSVTELREEALGGLSALGEREMALQRLGAFIDGWLHDRVVESVLQSSLLPGVQDPQEELGVRIRVEELRWQAALQATEELAHGVDGSFDWESEVAHLRQRLINQERVGREQKLWNSWESAREGMDKDAEILHDEALKIQHTDGSYLTLSPDDSREESMEHEKTLNQALESSGTWWTLGVLATAGLFGSHQNMDAIAAEESVTSAVTAATTEAPSWVAPSVLAFPVASYFLFTLYRNKVNPYAKLTDWVFGLVAMAIVGNIVLMATIGVRLY